MYHPQLDTFVAVVECGSFAKAAQSLYISTTAVIKQINALEEENARLLIEHEAAYSAARVEEYAREALGMQSPASGQIVYIESGDADWAEIPASEP